MNKGAVVIIVSSVISVIAIVTVVLVFFMTKEKMGNRTPSKGLSRQGHKTEGVGNRITSKGLGKQGSRVEGVGNRTPSKGLGKQGARTEGAVDRNLKRLPKMRTDIIKDENTEPVDYETYDFPARTLYKRLVDIPDVRSMVGFYRKNDNPVNYVQPRVVVTL